MHDPSPLLEPILALHDRIRAGVIEACARETMADLAAVAGDDSGDTIFRIDRIAEGLLENVLADAARAEPLLLLAEGLPREGLVLPRGASAGDCRWRILMDPIDGTRGLMYQKRSAWILTGVAPNHGAATRLRHIVLAVQTEIPLFKQHLCDQLWARRGHGVVARRLDRVGGAIEPLALRRSAASTLAQGFASFVRFFPGARETLGGIDDEVLGSLTPAGAGKASGFEDQYASTGGQLYELMAGHDRFIADLRPLVQQVLAARGLPPGLCCHPYDLCTALIAEEAGVVLSGPDGAPLDAPCTLESDVAWIGYANDRLRQHVEPVLQETLRRRGLLPRS
jgi:fructose-1,6-bisphosphatase/inositol monophosphatase family enzyme